MCYERLAPDQALANEILEKLSSEALIPEARLETIRAKILAGAATEGDWRSWVYAAEVVNDSEEAQADAEEAS